jgi:hypothetical protein
MTQATTLSLRDRHGLLACLVLATPAEERIAEICDEALFAEIAGAVIALPEMSLPERIQHAFEAQRLEIDLTIAHEIARTLFLDGLPCDWNPTVRAA